MPGWNDRNVTTTTTTTNKQQTMSINENSFENRLSFLLPFIVFHLIKTLITHLSKFLPKNLNTYNCQRIVTLIHTIRLHIMPFNSNHFISLIPMPNVLLTSCRQVSIGQTICIPRNMSVKEKITQTQSCMMYEFIILPLYNMPYTFTNKSNYEWKHICMQYQRIPFYWTAVFL